MYKRALDLDPKDVGTLHPETLNPETLNPDSLTL